MPSKASPKSKAKADLGNSFKEPPSSVKNYKRSAIFRVDRKGKIIREDDGLFLLNPASYEENKSANWSQHNIPGQSDPIMQWVSSGAKTLTFDALVTNDTSLLDLDEKRGYKNSTNPNETGVKGFVNKLSDAASSFFKISSPVTPPNDIRNNFNKNTLDISNKLNFYRSLVYPIYDDINNPKELVQSPPLVVLFSGRTVMKKAYNDRVSNNHELWVVTNIKIRTTKQLPNLAPMEAIVTFTLMHYNMRSFDSRRFS